MKKLLIALLLFSSSAFAGGSNPGLFYGFVPTASQWNSYFAGKLDYTPGTINQMGYWDGSGNFLNAAVSGDCTSVANVFSCAHVGSVLAGPGIFTSVTSSGTIKGAKSVSSVTTVGAATITASQMLTGNILRSGSTAAYTDTTDTAANIVASIPNALVGVGYELTIANEVAFVDTIAAGTGVTLAGTTAIAASASRKYVVTITNVATPAVTITGVSSAGL